MNDTHATPAAALHSAEQPDQGGQRPGRRPSRRPRRTGYSRGREDSGCSPWRASRTASRHVDPAFGCSLAPPKALGCTVLHWPTWISARGPVL